MKRMNSIIALASALFFALGTVAVAAERPSQDMNNEMVETSLAAFR